MASAPASMRLSRKPLPYVTPMVIQWALRPMRMSKWGVAYDDGVLGLQVVVLQRFQHRLGVGLHVPYKNGFYNVGKFKDAQSLHFAVGYPF